VLISSPTPSGWPCGLRASLATRPRRIPRQKNLRRSPRPPCRFLLLPALSLGYLAVGTSEEAQPERREPPKDSPKHAVERNTAEQHTAQSNRRQGRPHRRVVRPAPEGTDPAPLDPPIEPRAEGEND